ncbi:transposase [Streptomyces albogriseolus]|uniref:transposase n=1 Tax=Streptomyces albogriseolus TaxID=1887 RepID=UPI0036B29743
MWTRRQLIDGIRWRTRTGAPWRDVPERYGPWDRVYDLFRRWQRDGTWARILTQLQAEADAKGLITWEVRPSVRRRRARWIRRGVRGAVPGRGNPRPGVPRWTEPLSRQGSRSVSCCRRCGRCRRRPKGWRCGAGRR